MWEEYKAKESRIIRPINGLEFFTSGVYFNVTDVFPKFSVEEFKKNAEENLSKIQIFNYALKRVDGHLFWINKPFKMHLEEVEWTENEEIENHLKNEDKIIIPFKPLFEENNEVTVLYFFRVCQLKNNQTKLTFTVSHLLADGGTIFNLFDLIRRVINKETLEKNDEALSSFTGRENFQNLDESLEKPPKAWDEIPQLNILPRLPEPIEYVTIHYIYDYAPIKKFCEENDVGLQAMLSAMITRAVRKYKNLPKETKIWNPAAYDVRYSPYATEEYKKHQYYCNFGGLYPGAVGQNTLMEDIKHCNQEMLKAIKDNNNLRHILSSSNIINQETLQFIPYGNFPNHHTQAVANASLFGHATGNTPLFHIMCNTMYGMYTQVYHCYYTDDKLYIANLMPINMDKAYVDAVKEEMDKIFIPENITKN
ncbi:hypothetical protein BCR32DRAFT_328779 [Anaeromyces robustus]|uniref:CoA-dependent acyltransferase n=1 Tax=Anaeromyces robustus TaxID=1754192 RepID=A0A1Y1WXE3_9FUNG|nr:hypothetical protein BCR32DRAFT_328779 [Anaeromyces robustus]|eukprot:ORX77794.1 hypothetical protein BCR32DRAFT_328779 [Anaeromyces robustus]